MVVYLHPQLGNLDTVRRPLSGTVRDLVYMGVDSDIKSQAVIDGAQNINIVSLRLSHTDTRR